VLPANILKVTAILIEAVKREAGDPAEDQLDYTLGLVPPEDSRECGVQIENDRYAHRCGRQAGRRRRRHLRHGNLDAARHLIKRGGKLTCRRQLHSTSALKLPDGAGSHQDEQLVALGPCIFREGSRYWRTC